MSIRIRVALHAYTFVLLFLAYAFALLVTCAFTFVHLRALAAPLSLLYFPSTNLFPFVRVAQHFTVAPSVQSPASTLVNTPRGPPRGSSPPGSPRAHPYRRPASPATPPRRPRDAPRPPPLRNLRPFLGPDLAPFARAELAPRRPASPAAVNPGNFVLPADLDDNGDLLATVTSFPAQALKIMHDRWRQHLPLTMFTPKALKDSSRRPFSDVTYAQSTADGRIAFVAPDIDDRAELGLTESEWRQAIPAYLRLVHYHCSRPNKDRIVRGLQAHFEWIMARPDFYSDFVLYLQYDITIRKFVASMENYIPKEYECNIFMDIEKKYTRDLARGRILSTDNMHQTRPRSRSPSPRRNARAGSSRLPFQSRSPPRSYGTRPRGFDSRGQSFRQPSTVIFCIVCGRTGHSASACSPSGRTYLLLDKETNRWLAPGGAQLCYRWNNNAQACKSCTRDHRCTLCGDKGHNARACPRANP